MRAPCRCAKAWRLSHDSSNAATVSCKVLNSRVRRSTSSSASCALVLCVPCSSSVRVQDLGLPPLGCLLSVKVAVKAINHALQLLHGLLEAYSLALFLSHSLNCFVQLLHRRVDPCLEVVLVPCHGSECTEPATAAAS